MSVKNETILVGAEIHANNPIAFNKAIYMYLTYCFILLLPTKKLKAIYFTRKSDKFLTHYACLLREIGAAATKAVQSKMIYYGVLSTGRVLLALFVRPRTIEISEQKLQSCLKRYSQNYFCHMLEKLWNSFLIVMPFSFSSDIWYLSHCSKMLVHGQC